jgi:hypothetical protein
VYEHLLIYANLGLSIGHVLQHEDMLHDQQDTQEWWVVSVWKVQPPVKFFSSSAHACMFFVQGTIFWNDHHPLKEGEEWKKVESHLGRSASKQNFHDFYAFSVILLVIHFKVNKIQFNFQGHRCFK